MGNLEDLNRVAEQSGDGLLATTTKWGGRLVLGVVMVHFADSWRTYWKNNPVRQQVDKVLHHELPIIPELMPDVMLQERESA